MSKIFDKRENAKKHKVKDAPAANTLAKIAALYGPGAQAGFEIANWREIARFNWGTAETPEVNRALQETIGCSRLDLADAGKSELKPDDALPGEILIPKLWTPPASWDFKKQHTIKVKSPPSGATAIGISALDKWFIPGLEECEMGYRLEGSADAADKVDLEVYGSNYGKCTAWNHGYGTYEAIDNEPIYKRAIRGELAEERKEHAVAGWKGHANTDKGVLAVKPKGGKRVINAAFSPYTVHFRYYKDDADKTARLDLKPFWLEWEETKIDHSGTAVLGAPVSIAWNNAKDVERCVLRIVDKDSQLVHVEEVFDAAKLKSGAQTVTWDKAYHPGALNSDFGTEAIAADGPYTFTVTTITHKPKADSTKIKWEIKNTTRLEAGLLQVFDGKDRLVFQAALDKAKLDAKEFEWKDVKYAAPLLFGSDNKNSLDGETAIPADMPYRVQLQAHTARGQEKGLALAAMHTEVRFYVDAKSRPFKDLAFDSWKAKREMKLGIAALVPGDAPEKTAGTKWFRHQLAEAGFHPGPVTDAGSAQGVYDIAVKEFKRSVPKNRTGPDYERFTVNTAENGDLSDALENLEARHRRKWFGRVSDVTGNSNDPDFNYPRPGMASDAYPAERQAVDDILGDPSKEMVVWVDDRQYYTQNWTGAKDESNTSYQQPPFNLDNYRGGYDNGLGENRVLKDFEAISRPWIPLQAEPILLSRTETFHGKNAETDAEVDYTALTEERRQAMRRAIGPLRMDWTFEELPPDLSPLPTGYDRNYVRTKYVVAWTRVQQRASHVRKDTGRSAFYWNCPGGANPDSINDASNLGGARPTDLSTYYNKLIAHGDLALSPWKAEPVAADEVVATILHDHLYDDQPAEDEPGKPRELYEHLIGRAGVYFHPSRIAADGYKVRANLRFEKFGTYDFPNLAVLKTRYPVLPQIHTARLRIWRRSSIRGYARWTDTATGNWPGFVDTIRRHYRMSHLYFIFEGGGGPREFALTEFYDPASATDRDRYKEIIKSNVDPAFHGHPFTLELQQVWPWSTHAGFGYEWPSPPGLDWGQVDREWFRRTIQGLTWHLFSSALLFGAMKHIEKRQGLLRGPLFVEFRSSINLAIQRMECNSGNSTHALHYLTQSGAADRPDQACACGGTLRYTDRRNWTELPWDALGLALGATWLFRQGGVAETWAHEIGHQRHFEHAASAPVSSTQAARDAQHDSTANGVAVFPGGTAAEDRRWDRRCIMSYTHGEPLCFCGKCVLRHSGWKVESLALPAGNKTLAP